MSDQKKTIAVVGLGYVGLPLAAAFSKKYRVIGFDINSDKIEAYRRGEDPTNELGPEALSECIIEFTDDEKLLADAKFIVVATPTPVDRHHNPDLTPVTSAAKTVGRNLTEGAVVVFESTVYPGVTEQHCVPILERESGLAYGSQFKVGYSPERINPGDKVHRLETIVKVVAGCDEESLDLIADTYGSIIDAGVYRASSIMVAEAAKAIENAQRDINIAFVNELALIFDRMNIDTREVLEAAGTKWNFLQFSPGLVGGHCIGVDPYYLAYKANELGYNPEVILAGRRINDYMGEHIANRAIQMMSRYDVHIKGADVVILGATFKENVPDVRNSKVFDIADSLREYGVNIWMCDPCADSAEVEEEYGYTLCEVPPKADAIILAVNHDEYRTLTAGDLRNLLKPERNILMDVKGVLDKVEMERQFIYWRL
ncbi:MAG: nucleotide sugar dehydrogenase [Oscillospiraceae bacterium]